MMTKYILVEWPDSQYVMTLNPKYANECYPGPDSGYFVPEKVYNIIFKVDGTDSKE